MENPDKFIIENSRIISKILEVEEFNKEKLEIILETKSNKNFEFSFMGNACPGNFKIQTELNKKMEECNYLANLENFTNFLKKMNLYKEDYKIMQIYENLYKLFIDKDKNSEIQIIFYILQKEEIK